MRKIKRSLMGILIMSIFVVACKKNGFLSDDNSNKEIHNKKSNDNEEIEEPNQSDPIALQNLESLTGFDISNTPMPTTESEAVLALAPLRNNSLQYFYDAGLTTSDLVEEFGTLDNPEIAYAAIILEAMGAQGGISFCSNDNIWIKCLINLAIPCSIFEGNALDQFRQEVIEKGGKAAYNALPYSAKKALLKTLGKRAVQTFGGGPLTVAIFIYDYGSCLINSDLEPSNNELVNSTGFYVVPGLDTAVPFEFNTLGNYWYLETKFIGNEEALRNLTSSGFQQIANTVYYDGPNGLYSDIGHSTFAPDGFYWTKNIQGMGYSQFFYLKDGLVSIAARKYF